MRFVVLAACALMLGGCAARTSPDPIWIKTGSSPDERQQTLAQCAYDANVATAGRVSGPGLVGIINENDTTAKRAELVSLCMETKGYVNGSN